MFDVAPTELLLVAVVAVLVMGPKELPRALYKLGQLLGKVRGMARHFRTGMDAMIREAELEDLQKQWEKQNQRIMAETRITDMASDTGSSDARSEALPDPDAAPTPSVSSSPADHPEAASPPADAPASVGTENEPGQPSLPLDTPAPTAGSRPQ